MGSPGEFLWDVAGPRRPVRTPGVAMAGFADRGRNPAGLRLIPHPAVTVALMFGPSEVVTVDGAGRERRGSLAAGPGWQGTVGMRRAAGMLCLQVRVSPAVAKVIFGFGLRELVPAGDLWGREVDELRERLSECGGWAERFALADDWLGRRWRAARTGIDPEVGWAWRRIRATGGLVRVERVADEVGWSRKRLWARFHDQVGMPPKQAARLVRFDRAVHRLAAGCEPARVAADCGYADQPHLHRDVRAFTGTTPASVAGEPFLAVDDVAWPGHG